MFTEFVTGTRYKTPKIRTMVNPDSAFISLTCILRTTFQVIVRCYNTTLRAIIPLPDPNAPPQSAAHLNAYPQFSSGSVVMALYPDTSCFYRAEVVSSPSEIHPAGRVCLFYTPKAIKSLIEVLF
jgi:SGF29 tudor-like domain